MEESGSARRTATDMPAIPFVSGEGESKRNGTAASAWEDAGGGPASSNRISDNTEMIIFIMFSQKAIESTTSLNPSLVMHPTVGIPVRAQEISGRLRDELGPPTKNAQVLNDGVAWTKSMEFFHT